MSTGAPWLAHYDPDVPATLAPYPARTLVDYLADAARNQPDKPALLFKGATMTYNQLERLSDACAAAFAALGVCEGGRAENGRYANCKTALIFPQNFLSSLF